MTESLDEIRRQIAVIDCETTGLDPTRHEVWEVCAALWDPEATRPESETHPQTPGWRYHVWQLPVNLGRADPVALRIGQFHERRYDRFSQRYAYDSSLLSWFAEDFANLTRDKHMMGAVPTFDEAFLNKLLAEHGQCWEMHYHLIDIEAMAVGYQAAKQLATPLPWKSDELSAMIGVNAEAFEEGKHTAMGDCAWTIAQWEIINR